MRWTCMSFRCISKNVWNRHEGRGWCWCSEEEGCGAAWLWRVLWFADVADVRADYVTAAEVTEGDADEQRAFTAATITVAKECKTAWRWTPLQSSHPPELNWVRQEPKPGVKTHILNLNNQDLADSDTFIGWTINEDKLTFRTNKLTYVTYFFFYFILKSKWCALLLKANCFNSWLCLKQWSLRAKK